jgi:hypothetical protein
MLAVNRARKLAVTSRRSVQVIMVFTLGVLVLSDCMAMFSKQGSKGQAWHQDCAPEDAKKFNMNRLVYSSDITAHIGGQTLVVPVYAKGHVG